MKYLRLKFIPDANRNGFSQDEKYSYIEVLNLVDSSVNFNSLYWFYHRDLPDALGFIEWNIRGFGQMPKQENNE